MPYGFIGINRIQPRGTLEEREKASPLLFLQLNSFVDASIHSPDSLYYQHLFPTIFA